MIGHFLITEKGSTAGTGPPRRPRGRLCDARLWSLALSSSVRRTARIGGVRRLVRMSGHRRSCLLVAILLTGQHDAGAVGADLAQRLADLGGVESHADDGIRTRVDRHGNHLPDGILPGTGECRLIVRDRNDLLLAGVELGLDPVAGDDADHIADDGDGTPPRDLTHGDDRDGPANRIGYLLPVPSPPAIVCRSLLGIIRRSLP